MSDKITKIRILQIIVVIFLMLFVLDLALIYIEYENYLEKMTVIEHVLSTDKIETSVTEILKGQYRDISKGEDFLEQYGYHLQDGNEIYKSFLIHSSNIIFLSLSCFVIGTGILILLYRKNQKQDLKEIQMLEKMVMDFRKEEFAEDTFSFNRFEHKELERFYMELDSLGSMLQLLHERLRREKEETKSFVTDLSHQLKTPVAALKTSFEILQQGNLTKEEQIEFTQRCRNQLSGIEDLVSALMNISRMEIGMIEIKKTESCFFDTLIQAVNRIYEKALEKDIMIDMDAEEELEELSFAHDSKWLGEAIINVLENAIKYSPESTEIHLRMMKRTTFLRLEIEDQGIGIPKSEYNKVFQRFYRGDSDVVKAESGSGVGLYLTREIINRHHGTIRVTSGSKGIGTMFIIQLPYI